MQIVKAAHKIIVQHVWKENNSSLDGSSPVEQVKAFQDWMDIKHPNWVIGKNLNKSINKGYGKFGPSTTAAWNQYGTEFMQGAANIFGALGMPTDFTPVTPSTPTINITTPAVSPSPTVAVKGHKGESTDQVANDPKNDASKKQNNNNLLLIGGGIGAIILVIIIIKVLKK